MTQILPARAPLNPPLSVPTAVDGPNNYEPPIEPFTAWESWFAWRPVRLYMSSRYAWLRPIHRRCVRKGVFMSCDYTDDPDAYPPL
jgi:hypothetical protein